MRPLRWLLPSCFLLAAACSDSGGAAPVSSPGGSAGKAGSGGSGQAGSTGQAGAGGAAAGAGGSAAGQGGSSGAGAGGGGAGGSAAGSGGSDAGSGGSDAGTGGTGAGGTGACSETQADCDGIPGNGCETDLKKDALHCGACGKSCPGGVNSVGVCVQGQCALACNTGFASCDGDLSNGCETNVNTSVDHCGFCGNGCTQGGGAPALCLGGQCTLQCASTLRDCNLVASDGCEVDTSKDPKNCGTCGNVCEGGGECLQGTCECAGTSAEAKAVQLAMLVMLDKSGSMLDTTPGGETRWEMVKQALNQFFASAEATGIKVALSYFPVEEPSGTACTTNYYYSPSVPMGVLPGVGNAQVNALSSSMASTNPSGGTPTQVALSAAVQYAADWKLVFPADKTIVLLATDGQPGDGCNATLENSTEAASLGFNSDPSIATYVIGVGPLISNLDSIASAGGTNKAFLVNDGNTSAFLEALKQIKQQAVACEYALPVPPGGTSLNLNKVNFEYTSGGGQTEVIGNTSDLASCDPVKGGWYYDDPIQPTKLLLCPASCSTIQADLGAKVNVLLGCDTIKE